MNSTIDAALIRLLEIQHEHNWKLDVIQSWGCEMDGLRVDLLEVVFDLLGIPAGDCRDYLFQKYYWELREIESPDLAAYLRWLKAESVAIKAEQLSER